MESHYDEDHERNVGKSILYIYGLRTLLTKCSACSRRELAFKIDMTHLKTEGHLVPVIPGGKGGKAPVFEVTYKIVMRYDGLNIYFKVQYKKGDKSCEIEGKEYCLAADFYDREIPGGNMTGNIAEARPSKRRRI